jgi:hypothetical protein
LAKLDPKPVKAACALILARPSEKNMHILAPTPAAKLPAELASRTARIMTEAAALFLASLSPDQKIRVQFGVESDERLNWDYRPHTRQGISWKELDRGQQKLAHTLLASGLSHRGYQKAGAIMNLESVLQTLTGREMYDPDHYYLTVFGTPGEETPWGWRAEGHHLSLNFLVVEGTRIAATPNFFGANPARVFSGALKGLRVLAGEEDLARHLLKSLEEGELARALVAAEAPADILTGNDRRVQLESPEGIAFRELNREQQQAFQDLVLEYTSRMPRDVAEERVNRIDKEGWDWLHFAWAGSPDAGQPHYYRLHGPSFLVEYDNTQNQANHIHTVWRDLRDDWGEDLLRRHYRRSHGINPHVGA